MLCAISGETPQVPVVSRKSGNVYEKRLIESFITQNGTEPQTGEALSIEDLLDIKTSQTVRPRPPTLTSIPALLATFQDEWDALSHETFILNRTLIETRQELSTALYHRDAAVRVIARLTKERDEARAALARIDVGGRAARANGASDDSMQVDNMPLTDTTIAKIEKTQEKLMKTRRKRPVPEGWASADNVSSYKQSVKVGPLYPGSHFLASNETGELILVGGSEDTAGIYSVSEERVVQTLKCGSGGSITNGLWARDTAVISTSVGNVKVFQGLNETATFKAHSGKVTSLTLHPSGDIIASASEDKSYVLYDLETSKVLTQVFSDSAISCAQFHPDGHLLALGGTDGQIRFYDVKSGSLGGSFDTGSPLASLFFSENGTWVAAANLGSSVVTIWDLRKVGASSDPLKSIETGGAVASLHWDYTAQFLLIGGPSGVSVEQYTKSTKEWSEPLKLAVPASAVVWGPQARSIFTVDKEGIVSVIS